ncbi:hypothetical protein [Flavobacterium sp.]|uniref:hypothetical protein n=1 Tax=Flavobacterium sp. TaxID=239 RepID=UPI00286E5CE8|nr:hypothetical protein [Flavobacterium sp.]
MVNADRQYFEYILLDSYNIANRYKFSSRMIFGKGHTIFVLVTNTKLEPNGRYALTTIKVIVVKFTVCEAEGS